MKELGATLLVKTVEGLISGTLQETPQHAVVPETSGQPSTLKHAPKIFTADCKIDWNASAHHVYDLIRGLSPYPSAFTQLNGKIFKIHKAEKSVLLPSAAPGEFETDYKTYMQFACSDGYIVLKEVQPEGKKKMPVEDFLRGFRV